MRDPNFKLQVIDEPDASTTFYANTSAELEGTIFRMYTVEARASDVHVVKSSGKSIDQVSADVFIARVGAMARAYKGVKANVSLFKAKDKYLCLEPRRWR